MLDVVPCQSCAGATAFITELQSHGRDLGHRVYFCESCKRYTWTSRRYPQQQQQSQPEEDSALKRRGRLGK